MNADTFLPPIEQPPNLVMRLVYAMSRRQFGKVPTPITVFAARLPGAFGQFYGNVSKLDKKLDLPPETIVLVRQEVARINGCTFCSDIGRWFALRENMSPAKLDALAEYRTNAIFTEGERALLDYVSALSTDKHVDRSTFEHLARHYSDRQICGIVWLVASEHLYNMTNIGLNIHSDGLCSVAPPRQHSKAS